MVSAILYYRCLRGSGIEDCCPAPIGKGDLAVAVVILSLMRGALLDSFRFDLVLL
jgi:hypothetical protein